MAGYWDGNYGNDAIDFCDDADSSGTQPYCPTGFNQPAFADARPGLSPFPTYEQYAAVINHTPTCTATRTATAPRAR